MNQIRISLVTLGSLKQPVDVPYLEKWSSVVMRIEHRASVGQLPDAEGDDWQYTDEQLAKVLAPSHGADLTLGLINAPLEDNYFLRRLPQNVAILSLHEMAEIVQYENFTVETFILRVAYELTCLYKAEGRIPPTGELSWKHDDIRGCLFDMCSSKGDIVFSLQRPGLCDACRNRLHQRQVDAKFLPALKKELTGLKKTLYFRLSDWVRAHPILALALTSLFAIALNLVSSAVFEKAKRCWPWIA